MIDIVFTVLFFFLGSAFASFLGAQIYRIEQELPLKDLLFTPSQCEGCKRRLTFTDLIPTLGWLINRGQCKKCGSKVPLIYPVSEFLLGLSFVGLYWVGADTIHYIIVFFVAFLAIYDALYRGFPKIFMDTYLVVGGIYFLYSLFIGATVWQESGLFVGGSIGLLMILINLRKEAFGLGDVLLYIFLSFFYTWQEMLIVIWLSIILGGGYGALLLILKRVTGKTKMPFVPFIWLGLVTMILTSSMWMERVLNN